MALLTGKVALVTGAGGGLGKTYALLLAQHECNVVVNDLGGSRDGSGAGTSMADAVVQEISELGGRAIANHGSVANAQDAREMVAQAVEHFGKLDILIANAGILRDKTFKNMTDDMWSAVIDVHLNGTFYTAKASYDQMLKQGTGGRIIVTSSTSGLFGKFGQTNYGAAKAGIAGLARTLYLEGMKYGVTVNIIAPTATSRMTEDIFTEAIKQQLAPEKVAPMVVWLCSEAAQEISGRTFLVAGNRVALLSWQMDNLASKSEAEKPWEVEELGQKILETQSAWPVINPLLSND
ncbi:MAG: SDR family NAD(P)-dependent oxidoreductase [Gammaproteobacteria bacterium]|nr:SDR family NAD(P)-dependent oxidoreductase [Gammaproteobacteria bacterium]MDE0252334.1 SDR family NAD(P)-dependent oxidoreductase [Gammaproteobacteria bacterium]MDE0402557.1 SDR family NAD(P)-dependent oxidoreductase [Gammaproteobacteria bacterium]